MTEENKIRDAADAVRGVAESIPVYQDALQPAVREVGTALQTVAKTIHVALAPISGLVWGYEHLRDFLATRVAEKLKNVSPEKIKTPEPHVVGPALQALVYCGHQETLRELYANLLATSLDSDTSQNAHPAFVETIKNLAPDEARIMRLFAVKKQYPIIEIRLRHPDHPGQYRVASRRYSLLGKEAGCSFVHQLGNYLDNLERLGLIESPFIHLAGGTPTISGENVYEPLEQSEEVVIVRKRFEAEGYQIEFGRSFVRLTDLGSLFCKVCVVEKTAPATLRSEV